MKVTRERIEDEAPPGVAGYETDADYRYVAFTFDFDGERYGARVFDSDPDTADVLKQRAGPDDDERLAEIKEYLVAQAGVHTVLTIDPKTGAFAEWPR